MNTKKAMLSQHVAGKTDEWHSNEKMLERGVVQVPLCFYEVAKAYGLEIIFEKENQND